MASPELLEWCTMNGVCWHGIEAGLVAEGHRGVLATRDLPPGTCVLRVPRRLLISAESAKRDAELQAALQQCGAALTSEQVLAVHLLHEVSKGSSSFWQPYLHSLPHSYTTAMCFSSGEAAALQVPEAVHVAGAAAQAAAAQHAGALPMLRALRLAAKWQSRGAWLWAASTLSSRTMFMPCDSAGALTPFGDFCNYRPPPPPFTPTVLALATAAAEAAAAVGSDAKGAAGAAGAAAAPPPPAHLGRPEAAAAHLPAGMACTCTREHGMVACRRKAEADAAVALAAAAAAAPGEAAAALAEPAGLAGDGQLDEIADEYCIYARAAYAAGEQVFLCYGRHTNLELLQHYGFVLPDNPHDTAVLPPHLLSAAVRQQLGGGSSSGGSGSSSANYSSHAAVGSSAGSSGGGSSTLPGAAASAAAAAGAGAYLHANGAPSWDLLRALRLGSATSAERKASAYLALSDQAISASSEHAAFLALKAACEAALAALPSTAEQDEQLLCADAATALPAAAQQQHADPSQPGRHAAAQDAQQHPQQLHDQEASLPQSSSSSSSQPLSERMCVAVEWRLGYKHIMQRGIRLCDAILAALPPPPTATARTGAASSAAAAGGACRPAPPADLSARAAALQRKPRW